MSTTPSSPSGTSEDEPSTAMAAGYGMFYDGSFDLGFLEPTETVASCGDGACWVTEEREPGQVHGLRVERGQVLRRAHSGRLYATTPDLCDLCNEGEHSACEITYRRSTGFCGCTSSRHDATPPSGAGGASRG